VKKRENTSCENGVDVIFTLKQKRLGDLRKEMMAQVVGEVESVEGSCLENQHQSVVKVCQMKTKAADAGVNSTK
jgi:hypothetical protein